MKTANLSQWQADLLAKLDNADKISGATALIHAAGEAMKQGTKPAQALWEALAVIDTAIATRKADQ